MKFKCDKCNNFAVWFHECSTKIKYCDNCVPKGCFCNVDENDEVILDEFGSPYPCVDYDFQYNGRYDESCLTDIYDDMSEEEVMFIQKSIFYHHWTDECHAKYDAQREHSDNEDFENPC